MIEFTKSFVRRGAVSLVGVALLGGLSLLAGCPSRSTQSSTSSPPPVVETAGFHGVVFGGRQPIVAATIVAYASGATAGAAPTEIGSTATNSSGRFTMTFSPAPATGQVVYIVAKDGFSTSGGAYNTAIDLMTVAGVQGSRLAPVPGTVNIDELTTVASTAVLKNYLQFADCSTIVHNNQFGTCPSVVGAPGLDRMAATVTNLVNPVTGKKSDFLAAYTATAGSPLTATLEKMDTLANVLAACVNASGPTATPCTGLFTAALDNPTNTLKAAYLIAVAPAVNERGGAIFGLAPPTPIYSPVLPSAPVPGTAPGDWTIGGERHAYVVNSGSDNVSAYRIGAASALTAIGTVPATRGSSVASLAVDPTGRYVYAGLGAYGSDIAEYAIGAGGALTSVGEIQGLDGYTTISIAVDPTGRYVYSLADFIGSSDPSYLNAFAIEPGGALDSLGSSNRGSDLFISNMVLDPKGPYLYIGEAAPDEIAEFGIGAGGAFTGQVNYYLINNVPLSLAVSPVGPTVYAAGDNGNGGISEHKIDANGALSAIGATAAGSSGQFSAAVDPRGHYFYDYGANEGSNDVLEYTIGSDGVLAPIGAVAAGTAPGPSISLQSVAVDPTGRYVYVLNQGGKGDVLAYRIGAEGALTSIGAIPVANQPYAVQADPTGRYVYVGGVGGTSEYRIGAGRALTRIGSPVNAGGFPISAALSPTDRYLYVANNLTNTLSGYLLAPDGRPARMTGSPFPFPGGSGLYSVATDPAGGYVYVANFNGGDVGEFAIAPATSAAPGALHYIGAAPAGTGVQAIAVGPPGPYHYVYAVNSGANTVSMYTVDSATGVLDPAFTIQTGAAVTHPNAVAVSPNGGWFFVVGDTCNVGHWQNNPPAGPYARGDTVIRPEMVSRGSLPAADSCNFSGVAADPVAPYLYVSDSLNGVVNALSFNAATGTATRIGSYPATDATSVRVDPTGRYVYVTTGNENHVKVFAIGSDGTLTEVSGSPFPAGNDPFSIAIGP